MLEGPSAIAFVESDGDPAAVAKALADSARDTKVLEIRECGMIQGRTIWSGDVEELRQKLPPLDVLRGQVLAAVIAPLTSLLALADAPLQNLIGLIDARVEQVHQRRDRTGGRGRGGGGACGRPGARTRTRTRTGGRGGARRRARKPRIR